MDATKPHESIGFGAMDVTKPYKFIKFGAMDVTKPYKFSEPAVFVWTPPKAPGKARHRLSRVLVAVAVLTDEKLVLLGRVL